MEDKISHALNFFKTNSKIQEQFAEYFFLKDIIFEGASNQEKLDVARSDFDAFGFDLLISRHGNSNSKTVNIQLKATSGKCRNWDIHKSLLGLDNGRIIVVHLKPKKLDKTDKETLVPTYLMFDNKFRDEATNTSPKIDKSYKCKVKYHQFKDVTGNLLQIFD
jgi:hypothetical protein